MTQTPASGPVALVTTPPRSLSPMVTPSALCCVCAAQAARNATASAAASTQYQPPGIVLMSSLPVSRNDPLSTVVVEEPYEHLLGGERFVESVEPRLCCVGHDVVLGLKYKVPVRPV